MLHPMEHVNQRFGGVSSGHASGVVDKPNDVEGERYWFVGGGECHPMAFLVVAGEKFAGNEAPDDWWVAATLTGPVYRKFHTLAVRFICDFIGYFQFENGIFQSIGMNKYNLPVDAETPGHQTSEGHKDAVNVAGTIIVKVGVWSPGQLGMV